MGEGDEEPGFIRLEFEELPEDEMLSRAHAFYEQMDCLLYTSPSPRD